MSEKMLYYIDGYHGGIRGHMPLGSWRDILEMLKACPEWKVSIEVEPISWDFVKARDPAAYEEMREMLRDESIGSRLEIVSGSYAQPYGWITDGECNIRHLTLGIEEHKKHFPWTQIKTYAVQEPCWTSAMPQMLKSLGFVRAVLKNPSTAWGGYSTGFDAEVCLWEGPDGTQIPLAPRYACEELLNVWETESVNGEKDFAEKAMAHGIASPTGMYYQDLGWRANPRMSDKPGFEGTYFPDYISYSTWKEYFETIAKKPEKVWKITQEVFQGAVPWGDRILVRMARQVRRGEVGLLNSERLHALAHYIGGAVGVGAGTGVGAGATGDYARLREAWGHLLMTQHHDGWICAGSGRGERNWAWKTSAQIYAAESIIAPINRNALYKIGAYTCPAAMKDSGTDVASGGGAVDGADAVDGVSATGPAETLSVVNPLGRPETRTVRAEVTSVRGTESFKVYDGDALLPSQYDASREFADGSKNAGVLTFNAKLPGFGAKPFKIIPSGEKNMALGPANALVEGGFAYLENSFYRVTFDLAAGGTISSLLDKRRGAELVDINNERRFNEYSGYFIKEGAYFSSAAQPAEASVLAGGPVLAALQIKGRVNDATFTQIVAVSEGDAKITVNVTFEFPEKTYIGEPHEIHPEHNRTEGRRSYHDGRYKLNAYFPTAFEQKRVFKDAAYDVCESAHEDTHFKCWNEIKHNILIGWVDVSDGSQGLAIMADHTTSYTHGGGYPLGLTMAWGWDGGFWWGRRQLKGEHALTYAIVPHAGDWRGADIWHEHQKMLHQPIAQRVAGLSALSRSCELISVGGQVEMSAAYLDAVGRMMVRFFNPGKAADTIIEIDAGVASLVEQVELDGTEVCRPEVLRSGGKAIVTLHMPEFGIRTLRITQ